MANQKIIAEIGQNWCGDFGLALQLIDLAKKNGADLVKFQLYDSKKLYGEYQNTELKKINAFDFIMYGGMKGIEVFFSVFDTERVKWCEEIGVKRYKIAYSQNHNQELLNAIFKTQKPIIISGDFSPNWTGDNVTKLYCVPNYPAELDELDFDFLFPDRFVGYSDHTIGLFASQLALYMGAQIIEKHFAIDHKTGIDAEWSMTPEELKALVEFKERL